MMDAAADGLADLAGGIAAGRLIPYLGPQVLAADGAPHVPATPEVLVTLLTKRVAVPLRVRKSLTGAAQYIENFKHRKTLRTAMLEFFSAAPVPTSLHRLLAAQPGIPLIVDTWYDAALPAAFAARSDWGQVHGLSQSEHFGKWTAWYGADGTPLDDADPAWNTIIYKPLGCVTPGGNFLVSDADFVEVLTEIDIQTPIPQRVQDIRATRGFVFIGCRFSDQLARTYARQIMKRSAGPHYAVIAEPLTKNEARFMEEQDITVLPLALSDFVAQFAAALPAADAVVA